MVEIASGQGIRLGGLDSEDLARSEQLFRTVLEKLPAGAYTCDPAGLITYYNPEAVKLWGRAPKLCDPQDRFCGSFKLFNPDGTPLAHDRSGMAEALRSAEECIGQEVLIERPNGQRVNALVHASPLCDETGQLLGAVNVLIDISERKRATGALEEADRSKNEFLATLAHELRNPLAPIRNAVHILNLMGAPSAESRWAIEVIERQTHQMTRVIDDLLDIAHVSGNKLILRKERVELAAVIRTAIDSARPIIEACGHDFVASVTSEPIPLDADLTRLAQVFTNLLTNAAKYTERAGHIWLIAERQGSDAVVTVRDTGIGIEADMLPRIFDMFTQVERSLDRAQGGLGIGLTLVKRLVDLHEGSITVRSPGPGQGAEFVVRLPIVMEPASAQKGMHETQGGETPKIALRILVVDDNRDAAASLAMVLRILGNDIRTTDDGVKAVGIAEEYRPHVALLDIGLPRLNGYEVATKIRERPWGRAAVLIALTGWGQEADRRRSKDAGFDHHLVKPVEPATLVPMIASIAETMRLRALR